MVSPRINLAATPGSQFLLCAPGPITPGRRRDKLANGCSISAQVYANQGTETGAAAQAILTTVRRAVTASPLIPGLKSLIARLHDDPIWRNIRPPHLKLDPQGEHALFANFDATGVVLTPPA